MNTSEQYRAECEARYWLSRGYTNKAKTNELHEEIRKKRTLEAADYLIDNMRNVWKMQRQGDE